MAKTEKHRKAPNADAQWHLGPLSTGTEKIGSSVWLKGDKVIIPPAVHAAMLAHLQGEVDLEAMGAVFMNYWRVGEALYNLDNGDEDAVVRFLQLILRLRYKARSQETYLALWQMSRQPAWQARGIENILAYVTKAVSVQAKRERIKNKVASRYPSKWNPIAETYAERAKHRDYYPAPSVIDTSHLAIENIEFIRSVSTKRQKQIVDCLLASPMNSGDPFDRVSKQLNISRDNVRKQIELLNKKIDI